MKPFILIPRKIRDTHTHETERDTEERKNYKEKETGGENNIEVHVWFCSLVVVSEFLPVLFTCPRS